MLDMRKILLFDALTSNWVSFSVVCIKRKDEFFRVKGIEFFATNSNLLIPISLQLLIFQT